MAALTAGKKAPDFELRAMDGKRFVLRDELARGAVVLAFFKVSCPTCQYAFPFLQRLEQAYGHKGVRIIGVSQNDPRETAAFTKEFGVTFPVLLDDTHAYPASNAYGLTNVPTIFWVAEDGNIEISSVGWVKADFEAISRKMAEATSAAPATLFKPGEDVRDFRAG
ncbi:MAG: TlpA disulfide reductase family protein [Candidatus Sulfotelmatobacter sp.]